jgi:caa(3)-type oxidase subunit IV
MDSKSASSNHGLIFSLLVILVFLSVGVSQIHLSGSMNNLAIFGIAFVMAGLVAGQYMGLRVEGKLIRWLVIIPLVLFFILVILQFPDIAHRPIPFIAPHLIPR